MTGERFKFFISQEGEKTYEDTCYHLKLEIVKKIVNCKADEITRYQMLNQYIKNQSTNNFILDSIKKCNK